MICRTLVVPPTPPSTHELSIFTVMDDDKCSPETNYMIIRMQEYIRRYTDRYRQILLLIELSARVIKDDCHFDFN